MIWPGGDPGAGTVCDSTGCHQTNSGAQLPNANDALIWVINDLFDQTSQEMTLTISGSPTGGTFKLKDPVWGTTAAIPYNASAASVQSALNALTGAGGNAFAVSGSSLSAGLTIDTTNGALGAFHQLSTATVSRPAEPRPVSPCRAAGAVV